MLHNCNAKEQSLLLQLYEMHPISSNSFCLFKLLHLELQPYASKRKHLRHFSVLADNCDYHFISVETSIFRIKSDLSVLGTS